MKRMLVCLSAGVLCSSAVLGALAFPAAADTVSPAEQAPAEAPLADASPDGVPSYREFLADAAALPRPAETVIVTGEQFLLPQTGADMENGGVTMKEDGVTVTIPVTVEKAGLYSLTFDYMPFASHFSNIAFSLRVNGQLQFRSMDMLTLERPWKDKTEPKTDSRGNELRPEQVQIEGSRMTEILKDPEGRYNDPLLFRLKAGENTVTLTTVYSGWTVYGVTVSNVPAPPAYEQLQAVYEQQGYKPASDQLILLEAEHYVRKSDSSIMADSDKQDSMTSPSDPVKLLYNMIPGSRYSSTGQWMEYTFTPEQSGLYHIAFRVRQGQKSGFTSSRRLYINGEIPFAECENIPFASSNKWYRKTLGTPDNPYSFYFEAGKEYTVRLEIIPGAMYETTLILDDAIFDLNALYRSIVMIAGTNPDKYRDYMLSSEIPDFKGKVQSLIDVLKGREAALIEINSGKSGSALTAIRSLINRLTVAMTDGDSLAKKISAFKGDIESLSAWNMDAKEQPLDLDYIAVYSADAQLPRVSDNFFQRLWFELSRLFASYTADYGTVGDYDSTKETMTAWMAAGRDQMDVLSDMVTNDFTPKSGIQVKLSLVTAGINEAILAGKAPDVISYFGSDNPVALACRGVLKDLKGFEGFDEVSSWFKDSTMTALEYKGGCYGIPLQQTFNMMFVRTDILRELELTSPKTWTDMYEISAVLQRQNMEIGIPASVGMFASLLLQNGGEFYGEDGKSTGFDSVEAKEAFKTWTAFFSEYSFPVSYDLYNRFRSGEMPIGIAPYVFYTQLEQMAPEISGRWEMLPIPGTLQPDGSIDNSMSISAAAGVSTAPGLEQSMLVALMLADTEHPDAGWEFIKWLASADVQVEYGLGVEAAMGPLGRYAPANREAFNNMPWTEEQKEQLNAQWDKVVIFKEVPGGYAITRNLNNAFRRTIYDNENPVDMLHKYNLQINKELERKYKEFYS